jgi:penicillin-insensitive murein endopeptidase
MMQASSQVILRAGFLAAVIGGLTILGSSSGSAQTAPAVGAQGEEASEAVKPSSSGMTPGNIVQPIVPGPPVVAAKTLFGAAVKAADLAPRAIGSYARGCLAGGKQLAVDGPSWQSMRLSRNRQWGHPELVALIERLSDDARKQDGWSGLLVGDMSQPRGGPMITGHASHQIGLDADIWFTPMPAKRYTSKEREDLSALSMLTPNELAVNPKIWSPTHVALLKRAASYPQVERILVHPAIKKSICETTAGDAAPDRAWLGKVRPIWGHFYHFHIRIGCPKGGVGCQPQPAVSGDDGCGKELADWYKLLTAPPKPVTGPPPPPKPPLTLEQLPAECKVVLEAGRDKRSMIPSSAKR